ncbi:TetR family transcriptional regulator [Pseudomonas duriflava]|uniref:TetR family transcriptional regulator n=1 Tax=Pseudomonas duriflava TaxID=459528 RepID=A0A562QR51_9PSED|nr:TetR/AcrR family transcriptional regulator [Pseudomonas duriflava]TWI58680.1 TetR family transcriptional regulator [Pseudomonas duriflava]
MTVKNRPRAERQAPLDRLIEAALQVWLEQGYHASMDTIAERAGMSKRTVYGVVRSKGELFEAVIDAYMGQAIACIGTPGNDLTEGLCRYVRAIADVSLGEIPVGLLRLVLAEAKAFPEIARLYDERGAYKAVELLAGWLEQQCQAGRLHVPDTMEASAMLFGMVIPGPQRRAALGVAPSPTPEELDRLISHAVQIFLRGAEIRHA